MPRGQGPHRYRARRDPLASHRGATVDQGRREAREDAFPHFPGENVTRAATVDPPRMSTSAHSDPRTLLEHTAWVRALAARLARDAHEAEDLSQETWLALLRRPLAQVSDPRRFLAGVLRHRWRAGRRGASRRREREDRAARETAIAREALAPAVHDALEKTELTRALVDLVLELEEPFRGAILLRYGEDLAPHT